MKGREQLDPTTIRAVDAELARLGYTLDDERPYNWGARNVLRTFCPEAFPPIKKPVVRHVHKYRRVEVKVDPCDGRCVEIYNMVGKGTWRRDATLDEATFRAAVAALDAADDNGMEPDPTAALNPPSPERRAAAAE